MLSMDAKEELYEKHKGIIYYIVNRLRYLDPDQEELLGWGNLGFVIAMNNYEERLKSQRDKAEGGINDDGENFENEIPTFVQIAFKTIRMEIYKAYQKVPGSWMITSLNKRIGENGDSELGIMIAADDYIPYDEKEIYKMMQEALINIKEVDKRIVLSYYFAEKSAEELAGELGRSKQNVTRVIRRGKTMMKKYLVDNGLVSEIYESNEEPVKLQKKSKSNNYRNVDTHDYPKVKYMRKKHPVLTLLEMSSFLQVSTESLTELIRNPPIAYKASSTDYSIETEVLEYERKLYPERIPGDVIILQSKELQNLR